MILSKNTELKTKLRSVRSFCTTRVKRPKRCDVLSCGFREETPPPPTPCASERSDRVGADH